MGLRKVEGCLRKPMVMRRQGDREREKVRRKGEQDRVAKTDRIQSERGPEAGTERRGMINPIDGMDMSISSHVPTR